MPAQNTLVAWLHYVIEESGLHTRSEWGHIIGVSPQAQGRWLAGKDLPRPETLRKLIAALRDDTSTPGRQAMQMWEELAKRPLKEVCPGTRQEAATLDHLLVDPLWQNLQRTGRAAPPAVQERVVSEAIRSFNRYVLERDRGLSPMAFVANKLSSTQLVAFAGAIAQHGADPIERTIRKVCKQQSWWPQAQRG